MSTQIAIPEDQTQIAGLVAAVRHAIRVHADWGETAELVADALRRNLPGPEVLTPEQRLGRPDRFESHRLHIEPDGSFSIDANGNRIGESANETGDVSGFAPPGDIHRVRNVGDVTAISIHVYGTDVTRVGSSVRRYYDDDPESGR